MNVPGLFFFRLQFNFTIKKSLKINNNIMIVISFMKPQTFYQHHQPQVNNTISLKKLAGFSLFFYIILHTLFYVIEQLHHSYCTPCGVQGFIQSFFTNQSTLCSGLKAVSWHTSNASANMMSIFVSLIGGYITSTFTNHHTQTLPQTPPQTPLSTVN